MNFRPYLYMDFRELPSLLTVKLHILMNMESTLGQIIVMNISTLTAVNAIAMPKAGPAGIGISPNGATLYVIYNNGDDSGYGGLSIINVSTNSIIGNVISIPNTWGVAVAPSGQYAYITQSTHPTSNVVIISTATNSVIGYIPFVGSTYGVAFDPVAPYAVVSEASNNSLAIINTTTSTIVGILPTPVGFFGLSFSPNGQYIYATDFGNNKIDIINFLSGESVSYTQNPTWGVGIFTANIMVSDANTLPATVYNSLTYNVLDLFRAKIPITLTNYQSTAVATNTPIAIGTTPTGNIIGFNAIAYQQYETCNLNNAEFFFQNGTIATSWMERELSE